MKWFDYARPYSIGEAVQLLSGAGDQARVSWPGARTCWCS